MASGQIRNGLKVISLDRSFTTAIFYFIYLALKGFLNNELLIVKIPHFLGYRLVFNILDSNPL